MSLKIFFMQKISRKWIVWIYASILKVVVISTIADSSASDDYGSPVPIDVKENIGFTQVANAAAPNNPQMSLMISLIAAGNPCIQIIENRYRQICWPPKNYTKSCNWINF